MGLFGGKTKKKAATPENELPPIELKPTAFDKNESQAVLVGSRQLPGWPVAITLLATAMKNRADRIMLDYTAQGVAVRNRVDGVWESLPPMDRPNGMERWW